jgi:hypothetical protein
MIMGPIEGLWRQETNAPCLGLIKVRLTHLRGRGRLRIMGARIGYLPCQTGKTNTPTNHACEKCQQIMKNGNRFLFGTCYFLRVILAAVYGAEDAYIKV